MSTEPPPSNAVPEADDGRRARLIPQVRGHGTLYWIFAICVVIELLLYLGAWGLFAQPRLRETLYENAAFWPGLIGPWRPNYPQQPYLMFLTYAFLHGGFLHLSVNMLTLLSLGQAVVTRVGQRGFMLIFLVSVLGGGLGYGLLTNAGKPMVGASGGLFGLTAALLAWNYVDRFTADQGLAPILQAVVALILFNIVLYWLTQGHIAWETHLGGFIAGWVAALLADPRSHAAPGQN